MFKIFTTNNGPAGTWDGDVWESDVIGAADEANAEYIRVMRENMLPYTSEVFGTNSYDALNIAAEIDKAGRHGARLCAVARATETVMTINDGLYRVELIRLAD